MESGDGTGGLRKEKCVGESWVDAKERLGNGDYLILQN